jgi:ribonuclease HI
MKIKNATKIRLNLHAVSVYTTAKAMRSGIGAYTNVNMAVKAALEALEALRDADVKPLGLCGMWNGMQIQIDIVE